MNKYVELMEKSEDCIKKSIEFARKGEDEMSTFWYNAGQGFKLRARALFPDV